MPFDDDESDELLEEFLLSMDSYNLLVCSVGILKRGVIGTSSSGIGIWQLLMSSLTRSMISLITFKASFTCWSSTLASVMDGEGCSTGILVLCCSRTLASVVDSEGCSSGVLVPCCSRALASVMDSEDCCSKALVSEMEGVATLMTGMGRGCGMG